MMQEYNNLPLRFSRQLSLDQMNEAVDYVNAVVEGKKANSSAHQGARSPFLCVRKCLNLIHDSCRAAQHILPNFVCL